MNLRLSIVLVFAVFVCGLSSTCSAAAQLLPWELYQEILILLDEPIDLMPDGVPVVGSYLDDNQPVAGALVAVVPAGLRTPEPYVVPLQATLRGDVVQDVFTDEEGSFRTPPVESGEYFLEAILPTGRVHYSPPFTIPEQDVLLADLGKIYTEEEIDDLVWELEPIEVDPGASMTVWIGGADDFQSLPEAWVSIRQGEGALDLRTFLLPANDDGETNFVGLDLERPARITCEAPGYRTQETRLELAPAFYECLLEEWAWIVGRVVDFDDAPAPAVVSTIAVESEDGAEAADESDEEPAGIVNDADGSFRLRVPAGEHLIRAVSPGHAVSERNVFVAAGETFDVGDLRLEAGREVLLRVVDAETEEPLVAVTIVASEPPGAVDALTDLDGEAAVLVDDGRPLHLLFSTPDYAPRKVVLTPEDLNPQSDLAEETITVALQAAGWIEVVLTEEDDEPCVGCRAVVLTTGEELIADEEGRALSEALKPGYHRVARPSFTHLGSLVIENPRAETRWVRVEEGEVTRLRFLREGERVEVRIDDPPDGFWRLQAGAGARSQEAEPGEDGAYVVRRREGEVLALSLRKWDAALGGEHMISVGRLPTSGDEIVVRLPETSVRGRVQDFDDRPLQGARIRLLDVTGVLIASTRTDLGGGFLVPHAAPGVYSLMVGETPLSFVRVDEGAEVDLGIFEVPTFPSKNLLLDGNLPNGLP